MDANAASKKRKVEENGGGEMGTGVEDAGAGVGVAAEDIRKMIETFSKEQLMEIVEDAASKHMGVLEAVRKIADIDPAQRKLFVRGLGWETTTESLKAVFAEYGELAEGVVIMDKTTGKSKGYGFITFKHMDGAIRALKEPSKKIDGRMTVSQLASAGSQAGHHSSAADVSLRKIYISNVPLEMPSDRLLAIFSQFGEIEEGPLGFDKLTGRCRGYAMFIYKSVDACKRALAEPEKIIDGNKLSCKLATEGHSKNRPPMPGDMNNNNGGAHLNPLHAMGIPPSNPNANPNPHFPSYLNPNQPPHLPSQSYLNASAGVHAAPYGAPPAAGAPSSGGGFGGSSHQGPGGGSSVYGSLYGVPPSSTSSQSGGGIGAGAGAGAGAGTGAGAGSGAGAGAGAGGHHYPEAGAHGHGHGHYPMSSYQSQHQPHHQHVHSPAARAPGAAPGAGMYPHMSHYYNS